MNDLTERIVYAINTDPIIRDLQAALYKRIAEMPMAPHMFIPNDPTATLIPITKIHEDYIVKGINELIEHRRNGIVEHYNNYNKTTES